jgi:NAD+ kinase
VAKIGIIPNVDKTDAIKVASELAAWLEAHDVTPVLSEQNAALAGRPELGLSVEELVRAVDFAIVLGGDGTLLSAAKILAPVGKPILGVNLGHLGFLTEIELPDLYRTLPEFLAGRYQLEERIMLEARVIRDEAENRRFLALNEVVVSKGSFARLIQLETYVDERLVATYPADGLIVATPTGSTAYSLSAGGPVVNPNVGVVIITPICPHTLYARAVIVSESEIVRIRVIAEHQDNALTIDGQRGYRIFNGDTIEVRRAREVTKLMRLEGWSFYEVLRRKLQEGGSR